MILWLLTGLAAGALAKLITPQKERGGWISSLVIGILGSFAGKWLAGILGIKSLFGSGIIGEILLATGGAVLLLFVYHRFFARKWKLPI